MNKAQYLTRTLQEYLKSIYRLKVEQGKKVIRVKDIAAELKVTMPSVTDAMKRLTKLGLVYYERYGFIDLTHEGEKVAKELYDRWIVLKHLLHDILGIPEDKASTDACNIEHDLSKETAEKIALLTLFIDNCLSEELKNKLKLFIETRKC